MNLTKAKIDVSMGRRVRLFMSLLILAFVLSPAALAQTASNTATVAPPNGVTDPNCNVADPPCNSATDTDVVEHGIALTKVWVNALANDAVDLTIGGGNGATGGSSVAGGATTDAAATAAGGATITLGEAYTVGNAANYAVTLACVRTADGTAVTVSGSGLSGTITMPADSGVTCTFTNSRIAQPLNLAKVWAAGSTAGHTATATTTGGTNNATFSSTAATNTTGAVVTVYAGDVVTLPDETFGGGATAASYTAVVECSGGSTLASGATGRTLTISDSTTATTCTYTNTPVPATLTLAKTVVNDDGGTAVDTDFTLTATGPTTISGVEGDASITAAMVDAGTYTLSETNLAGYTAGAWTCDAGTLSGDQLTLANAEVATCTITNDDQAATLTLAKTVVNDDGGTAVDTDFTLSAAGPTPITGVEGDATITAAMVDAGTYTLSETNLAGYTAGTWSCDAGTLSGDQLTLANGETATCTITNDDQAATLTLAKTVVNDDGGTAVETDFTLSAAGPTPVTGVEGDATITAAMVDAGTYTLSETNLAGYTAGAWTCDAGTLSGDQLTLANGETATCTITNDDQAATLTLAKTVVNDDGGTAVDTDFTLTATGPTTISGVDGDATITAAAVDAGTYTLSEVNLAGYAAGAWTCDAGTLSGDQLTLANGETATCTITNDDQAAMLTLEKVVDNTGGGTAVDTDWTLSATGPTPISGVEGDGTVTAATVDAGTYTLSEAGAPADYLAAAAWVCSGATVNGGNQITLANGETATCSITNTFQAAPAFTLTKTAGTPTDVNGSGLTDEGDTIAYTFTVENTGNVPLQNVVVTDPLLPGLVCTFASLPVGDVQSCGPEVYTVQAGDEGADLVNTATLDGEDPDGNALPPDTDSTTTPIDAPAPALLLAKTASPTSVAAAGETVTYSFDVENTGNVTIDNLTITETAFSGTGTPPAITCPVTTLAPGAITVCTGTYTVTQADIDAGSVTNTATADGTDPDGDATTSPPDSVTVTADQTPALTIAKVADTATYAAVGDVITYTYTITNAGNVTLAGPFTVNDDILGTLTDCATGPLAPTETTTCTAMHSVDQDDLDAGTITNTATATDGTTTSPPDSVTVTADQTPALTIAKVADTATYAAVGDVITYTYTITNAGNVTLAGPFTVNDDILGTLADCATGPLAPGASTTCTAMHLVDQDDLDAGTITNTATATDGTTTSPPDSVTVTADQTPALTIDKAADTATYAAVGDVITYTYTITNAGNVTLAGPFTVNDDILGTLTDCATGPLAPGASTTCTAMHSVDQDDLDAGTITNTATATDGTTTSPPDSVTVTADQTPELTLTKTASPTTVVAAGETVTYSFDVENTGNVTIDNLTITETAFSGTGTAPVITCPVTTLAPGETTVCTGTYAVTQADIDAGSISNTATADGIDPTGGTTTSPPDSATVTATPTPALDVVKTAGTPTGNTAGDTITYTFTVTNTGNVTVDGIAIDDAQLDAAATCDVTTLAPGAVATCTGVHTITQAEVDAGTVDNTATATGTDPTGTPVVSPPDSTSTPIASAPALDVVKTAGTPTGNTAGDTITYTFTVTNTGNVTVDGIAIDDAQLDAAATCDATTLAPGAVATCSGVHTITQAEVDAGTVDNTATATGDDPTGTPVVSPPDSTSTPIASTPALDVAKTAGTPTGNTAGDTITYTFTVTNTGNVTVDGIAIDDAQLDAAATCDVTTLAPGAVATCTGVHTITQAEVDAGMVDNTATATGNDPTGTPVVSPPDSTSTPISSTPALDIVKTAGTPTGNTAGDTITYTFTVTNTGNVTVDGIAIDDAQLDAAATCDVTTLAPGAVATCIGVHTITQAEVDAGMVDNTATATGNDPTGTPVVSPPDSTSTPISSAPALTLAKTASPTTVAAAGETVTYSFDVQNTGNVTIDNLTITETAFSGTGTVPVVTCPVTTLAPGETTVCTGTYAVTQADIDAGSVTNTATADGTDPSGTPTTSPPDSATVTATPAPALTLAKSASPTTVAAAGETVTYSFDVTNSGNVTIDNLTITETAFSGTGTPPAITCPVTTLAPGETTVCTGTYTVTQADIDAGSVTNTATADGTDPSGTPTTSPPDSATVTATPTPALTLAKSASPTTVAAAGETVTYSFDVENTGNVTIDNLTITETAFSGTGTPPAITCPVTTLAPGATTVCTGTYVVTQADIDAGSVTNTATADGTDPSGGTTTSPPDSATVTATPTPALTLTKTASPTSVAAAGETVTYSFDVENTGNVTIDNLTITETAFSGTGTLPVITCPVTTLAPGETTVCTGTYAVTQADIDAGTVTNTATADGTDPTGGTTTSPPDSATVTATPTPALTLTKTASPTSVAAAGETVTYSFDVTNSGNVTIDNLTITETAFSGTGTPPAITCPVTTLAPGATTVCTGTYAVTQADIDAGSVTNTATADGTDPTGGTTTSPPDSATVTATPTPALDVVKTAGTPTGNTAGDTITYTFTVTNTGNVTVDGIAIDDAQLDEAATCDVTTLAPGAVATCSGVHTITQAEVDAGTVDNTATATGDDPTGTPVVSPPDSTSTPIASTPALDIVKTAGTPTGNTAGDTITYTFTVTNTGNVTVDGIVIDDAQLDAAATCDATTLAPGAVATCSGVHTITQAEVDAGTVDNTATATGDDPTGTPVVSPPDSTSTPIASTPALDVVKTAGTPTGNTAGDTITYTFTVTNTGNVTVDGIAIDDAQLDAAATCDVTTLAPGAVATCTGVHTITQAEVDAGTVDNTATATGTDPTGTPVVSPPDSTSTPISSAPALDVVKTAGTPTGNGAGDTITYTFTVTNTGNVTVDGIAIDDAQLDAAATCDATTLAPGAVATCTGVHTITQAEVDAGTVDNTATATGNDPTGTPVVSPPDSTSTPIASTPALDIVKTAGTPTGNTAGDTITYTFTVTNTGNVTVDGIAIDDAQLDAAATCDVTTLAPGAVATCIGVHTITQAEVDAGTVDNTATATGDDPTGTPVVSPPDSTSTPIASAPALDVAKTAGTPTGNGAGDTITYTFTVTNTGNVTVDGIAIDDAQLDAVATCDVTTLAPGAVATCSGVHTITQAEVDAGTVDNTATATGDDPTGTPVVSPPDSTSTPIASAPALTLTKTASPTMVAATGETVTYSFDVTNSGNVTIDNLTITETAFSGAGTPPAITCPVTTLAPGETTVCTGTYTVTQADIDAGSVTNTATADGTDPSGTPTTSPPDSATVTATPTPALTLTKTASPTSVAAAGETVTYSFDVQNTGNVTIDNLTITETAFSGTGTPPVITCPVTTLAPGATTVCTGTYVVTQADIDAGSVTNTATADGTDPTGTPTTSPPDSATVTVDAQPAQTLLKELTGNADEDGSGTVSVDDTLTYRVTVTNTGNTTLTDVVVNDSRITPNTITCATVAPGATCVLSGTYVVAQADADAGTISNTATSTSPVCPAGSTDAACTTTIVTLVPQTPALTLVKAATPTTVAVAGETVTYTFDVENTGNVTIDNLTITETAFSGTGTPPTITCPVTTLAPGETTVCTGSYVVTQADIDAGSISNTATADGTDPSGTPTTSPPDSVTVTATPPVISTAKASDPATGTTVNPGDTITYTLTTTIANAALAADYTLTDTLSGDQTFGSVTDAGAYTCTTGNPLVCTLPAGTAPGTYEVTYTATVDADASGTVGNSVAGNGGGDPDPECTTCTTGHPVALPVISTVKSSDPATGSMIQPGQTVTYTLTTTVETAALMMDYVLSDTLSGDQTFGAVTDAGAFACSGSQPLVCTLPAGTAPGSYALSYTATIDMDATGEVGNVVVGDGGGDPDPECANCETAHPVALPAIATSKASDPESGTTVSLGQTITYTLTTTVEDAPLTAAYTLTDTLSGGQTFGAVTDAGAFACNAASPLVCTLPAGTAPGVYTVSYTATVDADASGSIGNNVTGDGGGDPDPECETCSTEHRVEPAQVRLTKQANPRDVKIGDLVRYTLVAENIGQVAVVDATLVDTPPAGFSYVDGSLQVADDDGVGRLVGTYPISVDQIDIGVGQRATISYLLRVGAGVRPGVHTNTAEVRDDGERISNIATADVQMVSDPLVDDSLIMGTVFDDRDEDGWQDSAAMDEVRVQGGFAPGAYVAGSTTLDRGDGPRPEPDASAPLLHGIAIGGIDGRQSDADPVEAHRVVVSQTLSALEFTDDFVLTTKQGVSVRMDAAGNTTVDRSQGDAGKGLTAAAPTVERRVAQAADGYRVDYVISNEGVDERGIPGVRIASVEGLLMETDQFGRYHVVGIDGGRWERGRNFILKVDPATLPPGSVFTTDNPLLRRITPGLPVRFDFGVKLPNGVVEGGRQEVEMKIGEVFFRAGSAEIDSQYLPAIEEMADKVHQYGKGEVDIIADGDTELLALERAIAVRQALEAKLSAEELRNVRIGVYTEAIGSQTMVVGFQDWPLLGTVLFDTDKATIKPQYKPLLERVAKVIGEIGTTRIAITGHTDLRASDEYNLDLGLRRARAVLDEVAGKLDPEVRKKLRIEVEGSTRSPVSGNEVQGEQ